VPLASLNESALVPAALAHAVGVVQRGDATPHESLVAALRDKSLLLVIDNLEHLMAAVPEVATLLIRCPGLRILATSRVALRVQGEQIFPVRPLAVPDPAQEPAPARAASFPAVALFVQRAQAMRPDFALTEANTAAVAAICRQLDGLPLAIELAAARIVSLPATAIAERLGERFRLLTGGPRDALPRQQTLRATLDWSWELLSAPEQALLRRLSVFAGGWTLAAAEAVCAGDGIEAFEILDLLGDLIAKSLVQLDESRDEGRYRLLETVRRYAGEQLAAGGEATRGRDRHLAWCVALAEEAAPQLTGPAQGQWLARLEVEHDNLRAGLRWAREQGEAEQALRLAGALWRFWNTRGHISEGRAWLEAALAGGACPAALRATALNGAGVLAFRQGEYGQAAALHEEALALRRALGETSGIVASLSNLGLVAYQRGEYGRAAALLEESLALERTLGNTRGIARSLSNLGLVAYQQGDHERASALHEESLALEHTLGNTLGIAYSLSNLGRVAYQRGEYERAAALHEEALVRNRELGDKNGIATTLIGLGNVAYRQGDYGRTEALLQEVLLISRDVGARDLVAEGLEILTWVAEARGQSQRAARFGGAAEALRDALGMPLAPEERDGHDEAVRAMHQALGEEGFASAWAAGRALSQEAAVAEALASPP
jgi:predicted ATPase/Tfp pilus assembly protein PilF